ncbi:PAS domain S-box protein [Evansella sp. AB-P1]|uniref:PAS domain-containing sensor histidine kinase n=1 Tax=Evansella sp. AB-P1 TaxID=3037653 RepID=UPI00241DA2EA|nr:PAS domain-containing sensor histidine kinase [Evansella sp. AB-P1]MDG5786293.1 PAS domain S-box protein [Evansella sp. AB-P1]
MKNETEIKENTNKIPIMGDDSDQLNLLQSMLTSMDHLDEGVMLLNQDWELKFINLSACKLLRCTREEMIGRNMWEKLPEKIKKPFSNSYNNKMIENQPIELNEYYSPTKTWFYVQAYTSDSGLTVIFRDTTEKHAAMQVMEQAYRTLFDGHPDAVCSVDLKGRILSINTAFKEIFAVDEKNIVGDLFIKNLSQDKQSKLTDVFEFAKKGSPKTIEINLTEEMERPFYIMVTAIPIIANSQIIGIFGIIKDITKDYHNIEEIRRLFHMNQLIMESVEDGILGIDRESNVVMWNEAAERITGYHREELTHKKLKEIVSFLSPTDNKLIKKGFSRTSTITKDTVIRRTGATFYRKDGTPFLCEFTITPMVSSDEIVGSVFTFRDITEKKKSEELLHQSEKLSAVGQLAAGIAHEIRNPLTSLKGFLQLIKNNNGGKKEYFDIMMSEFMRIEQILNELLVLSKPQSMKKEKNSLDKLLNHTVTLLNTQAIIKNIEIETKITKKDINIKCSEHQIKQVFVNLIKNAIEAMDNGGKIIVSLEQEMDEATVRIIDEGCGIPEEKLKRLGDPFFTTKESGTGLGLMVSYKIIEDHGGEIHIHSIEGSGTTFTVKLPTV